MATMVVSGLDEAKRNLKDLSDKVVARLHPITRHYGALVQADVRARARQLFDVSDYDRTIELHMRGKKENPGAVITSTAEQSHRLEYGFTGVDSLGRSDHQPPRPHFRPALAKYASKYRESIEALFQ